MNFYKDMQIDKEYDCVVIGGGASGMMAAITAARNGAKTAVIEHTHRLGSKILQTGNGKCNFTNLNMDIDNYQNDNSEFVSKVISSFDNLRAIDFFKELGVWHKEKNGYVYPHSETAASLQDALRMELQRLNVDVYLNTSVDSIDSFNDCYYIRIFDGENNCKTILLSRNVIIATGSKAAPKTGSDGSGYKLCQKQGHTIVKPLPALVQLISDSKVCKVMAGVRSTGNVRLYVDDELVAEDTGEVQYTDYGISGIPVFQISRYAVKAVDKKQKVQVHIDMIPDILKEELYEDMRNRFYNAGNMTVETFFAGIINKKLVNALGKCLNIDACKPVQRSKINEMYKFINLAKDYVFDIVDFKGWENGQICQGGVALSEINPDTMESLICKGLYFAGEVVDVDGKCGGYNLQWAWSSGFVAGLNAGIR